MAGWVPATTVRANYGSEQRLQVKGLKQKARMGLIECVLKEMYLHFG